MILCGRIWLTLNQRVIYWEKYIATGSRHGVLQKTTF
jgi:hypothetical protein